MYSFKNKTVLVTGGASGIGFLLGLKALRKGASKLIIWDINQENLQEAVKKIEKEGFEVYGYKVDINEPKQIQQTAELVQKVHGTMDVIFNNAGVVFGGNFATQDAEHIIKTMNINALGLMLVAHAFLPAMIKQADGYIINITSAAGLTPNPGMAAYAGSKWAAVGWSESLKLELQKEKTGVQVLTVMPGYINTGMFDGVKSPFMMPLLDQDKITTKIITSIEKGKSRLREPFLVKLTPFFKGFMPAPVYDFLAGKLFRVYSSMDTFKGRGEH